MPALTTAEAIDAFIEARGPNQVLSRDLARLREHFSNRIAKEIDQSDINAAAATLYPNHSASTRHAHVYSPTRQVLALAGSPLRVRSPRRPKPSITILSRRTANYLIRSASDSEYRALLTFLFYSGARICEAMALTPDCLDYANRRVRIRLARRHIDHWRPLHPRAASALKHLPAKADKVFRWQCRWGPEKPLLRLRERTGVPFTYKMARYSFAWWLADEGASARDIMDACGIATIGGLMAIMPVADGRLLRTINRL